MALTLRLRGIPADVRPPKLVALTPEQLDRFVGTYGREGDRTSLRREGSRLLVTAPDVGELPLMPVGETEFLTRGGLGMRAEFGELRDGKAQSATFAVGPIREVYARVEQPAEPEAQAPGR